MLRTLLLAVLLLLILQRQCSCTSSNKHLAGLSWEAARAAAKAEFKRAIHAAGLKRPPGPGSTVSSAASEGTSSLVPQKPDGSGTPSPISAGSYDSQHQQAVTAGGLEQFPATAPAVEQQGSCQDPAAGVQANTAQARTAPLASQSQQLRAQRPDLAGEPYAAVHDPHVSPKEATEQQPHHDVATRPGHWAYGWLLVNFACFLLGCVIGWFARGQTAAQDIAPPAASSSVQAMAGTSAAGPDAAGGRVQQVTGDSTSCISGAFQQQRHPGSAAAPAGEMPYSPTKRLRGAPQQLQPLQQRQKRESQCSTEAEEDSQHSGLLEAGGVSANAAHLAACNRDGLPAVTSGAVLPPATKELLVQQQLTSQDADSSSSVSGSSELLDAQTDTQAAASRTDAEAANVRSEETPDQVGDIEQEQSSRLWPARRRITARRRGFALHQRTSRSGSTRHSWPAGSLRYTAAGDQGSLQQGMEQHLLYSAEDSGGLVRRRRASQPVDSRAASVVYMQLPQQGQLAPQHPVHVVITAGPEMVHALLVPGLRVLQQLATGVQSLSVLSTAVVHHLHQLTSGVSHLTSRVDSLLSWAKQQDLKQRLAAQQVLAHNSGQLGLGVLLVAIGVTALRVGRVWEVHRVCHERSQEYVGSWRQRLTGTQHVTAAWIYTTCGAQELGLYAAGLMILYWLAKATLFGLLFHGGRARPNQETSRNWLLDIVMFKGVIWAVAGAHIVHSLGAAWLPWLLLWWLWCSMQALLQTRLLHRWTGVCVVFLLSLGLPVAMAVVPFHATTLQLQGWLFELVPVLERLPNIKHLLPF